VSVKASKDAINFLQIKTSTGRDSKLSRYFKMNLIKLLTEKSKYRPSHIPYHNFVHSIPKKTSNRLRN